MSRNQFEVANETRFAFLLCLPLIAELAFEGYSFVERERLNFGSESPVKPSKPAEEIKAARKTAEFLTELQKPAVLLGNKPPDKTEFSDETLQKLASALHEHEQEVYEGPGVVEGAAAEVRKVLQGPEASLTGLKKELTQAGLDSASRTKLTQRIDACRKHWEALNKGNTARRAQDVLEFLDNCDKVVKVIGEKLEKIDFQEVDAIATASPELQHVAKEAALTAARNYWATLRPVEYDNKIGVHTDGKLVWYELYDNDTKKPTSIYLRVDGLSPKGTLVHERKAVQFTYAKITYSVVGKSDVAVDKLRPTKKSLVAHSYNEMLKRKPTPREIEEMLWTDYQQLALKHGEPANEIGNDSALVLRELADHYPEEGKKLSRLVNIVRGCKTLFR